MLLSCSVLVLCAAAAQGAPSWPIMYAYSPDNMPIVEVRLAPPHKPMPEVAAFLGKLEKDRVGFEAAHMLEVEAAYNASWEEASEKLPMLIDRLMRVFEKPSVLLALRKNGRGHGGNTATTFREAQRKSGGHEMTARINILPAPSPDPSLESSIQDMEDKRSKDEGNIFKQAVSEMGALTKIVQNELEAQIMRHTNNFLHAVRFGLGTNPSTSLVRSTGLLAANQPVLASGPQLTTNVRIMASDEPFPAVAGMVENLERQRDAGEGLVRTRLMELELKLLQAENKLVSDRLATWIEHLLRAGV